MLMFQLEDQYRLFDYGINVNDVIQLMIRVTVDKKTVNQNLEEEMAIPCCSSSDSSLLNKVNKVNS